MSRALFDINVLLALLDADHVDHLRAQQWIEDGIPDGWASCPITENGFVRILSQPKYPSPVSPTRAIELLDAARDGEVHEFWACDVSILDDGLIDRTRVHGPRQVTDAYLLALAVRRGGRLVTFDRTLAPSAVRGAGGEHLVVL